MASFDEDSLLARRGPLLELLDMRPELEGPGRVRVRYVVGAGHLRSGGIAHGGVLATLLDTALGLSAASLAAAGMDVVTAQLNANFVRPARLGERLDARGEVQHAGRRTAVARAEVRTEAGELVATGSATLIYLPPGDLGPPTLAAEKPVTPPEARR